MFVYGHGYRGMMFRTNGLFQVERMPRILPERPQDARGEFQMSKDTVIGLYCTAIIIPSETTVRKLSRQPTM